MKKLSHCFTTYIDEDGSDRGHTSKSRKCTLQTQLLNSHAQLEGFSVHAIANSTEHAQHLQYFQF